MGTTTYLILLPPRTMTGIGFKLGYVIDRKSCVLRYLAIGPGADNPHPSMSLDKKDLHAADCINCRLYTGLLGVM